MHCGCSRASLPRHSLLVSRGVPVPVCCGVPLPLAFPCHWYSSLAPPTLPWRLCQLHLCHCGAPCLPLRQCGAPASNFATAPQSVSSSAAAPRPATSSRWHSAALLPASSSATAPRPAAPLRRPCQQQTSSGGEEYSSLASNLAHLGRIC